MVKSSWLIIKNLPIDMKESELLNKIEKYGKVSDCRIIFNKKNKNWRFGFIGFFEEKFA